MIYILFLLVFLDIPAWNSSHSSKKGIKNPRCDVPRILDTSHRGRIYSSVHLRDPLEAISDSYYFCFIRYLYLRNCCRISCCILSQITGEYFSVSLVISFSKSFIEKSNCT